MSVAFLFPGQGSQCPGMLHNLARHTAIVDTLSEASDSLGRNVLEIDSAEELKSTVSVQLALLIAGVATARALVAEGVVPEAVTGLSVGAFAAAVQCGTLSFGDAIRLVQLRAEAMEKLYASGYGLSAIVGLTESEVTSLVRQSHTEEEPVYLANINARTQMVIAGSEAGMEKGLSAALQKGAHKAQRLNVPVPSHCPLLEPVAASLRPVLKGMTLRSPTAIYISNVGARALRTAASIAEDLASNIAHTVRWFDATTVLSELGCQLFLEMPPGHVLRDLALQNNPDVTTISIDRAPLSAAFIAILARAGLAKG